MSMMTMMMRMTLTDPTSLSHFLKSTPLSLVLNFLTDALSLYVQIQTIDQKLPPKSVQNLLKRVKNVIKVCRGGQKQFHFFPMELRPPSSADFFFQFIDPAW